MTSLQYYKIVNKKTQESIILDGDVNLLTTFLKENNAFPNYKTFYEIYLCFDGIHIIHGVETPAKTETRINPIFLMNKKTNEVSQYWESVMASLFLELNGIDDYDLFYDEEVDDEAFLIEFTKLKVAKKKEKLLAQLQEKYDESIKIRVKNGVDFSVSLSSKEGDVLLKIIDGAKGSYDDEKIAKGIQSFYFVETLGGKSTMQETKMYNWIWLYIFEELPIIYKKINQIKKTKIIQINEAETIESILGINIDFFETITIDIPSAIRYIIANDADIVNGRKINIPEFVKKSIKEMNREVFFETDESEIREELGVVINNSFFSVIHE